MASPWCVTIVTLLYVGGGTGLSLVLKILFDTQAHGRDGVLKPFKKPWFALFVMGIAMSSSILKWWFSSRRSSRSFSAPPLYKVGLRLAIPGFLNMLGTFLQAVGLMLTPVSIYQMLQSSNIIFSALIRFFWMGKSLWRFEFCGIVLTAVGLSGVGVASIVSGGGAAQDTSVGEQVLGIFLILLSQAINAWEAVVEERAMHGSGATPEFVCGLVGSWIFLYVALIMMPIAQFLPGAEGNGLREDSIETFLMLKDSDLLKELAILFLVVCFVYNHTMRLLIGLTEATTMQVLGGMRTLCVWIAALLLYFVAPQYGEKWQWYTWIELASFLVLTFGVFLYKATFKFPCFIYPEPAAGTDQKSSIDDSTSLVPVAEGA